MYQHTEFHVILYAHVFTKRDLKQAFKINSNEKQKYRDVKNENGKIQK